MRIDMVRGRSPEQVRALADVVQEVMLDVVAAPPRDRYQVIHQHDPGEISPRTRGGLHAHRGVVVIQVTQQGRSREQKEAMYAAPAVTENPRDDRSLGRGRAQFLTGEL